LNKFDGVLTKIELFLAIVVFNLICFIILSKYNIYKNNNDSHSLNRKIQDLSNKKELLEIELVYLTSPERLLNLIEKQPSLLQGKNMLNLEKYPAQSLNQERFIRVAKIKTAEKIKTAKKYVLESNI
jgi:cell division protein FtsL